MCVCVYIVTILAIQGQLSLAARRVNATPSPQCTKSIVIASTSKFVVFVAVVAVALRVWHEPKTNQFLYKLQGRQAGRQGVGRGALGGGRHGERCMSLPVETLLGRLIGVVVRPKLCVLAKTNPGSGACKGKGVGGTHECTHGNVS